MTAPVANLPDLSKLPPGMTLEQIQRLITRDFEWWFTHCARIKTKRGVEISAPEPNILQVRVARAYREKSLRGEPCLIMILKPRQKGASTIAEGCCYQHMKKWPQLNGVLMGDVQATSDKVFEMYRRYAESDPYPWENGYERFLGGEKIGNLTDEITLGNGSKWWKETAGSKNAGRSGTCQVLHLDEVAYFTTDTGKDPTQAVLGSFYQDGPMSLGFATSTPNGVSGWFYNTWNEPDNGWIKIFAAWFEFADSVKPFRDPDERARFAERLDEDERQEQALYKVTLEQLNWRRHIIRSLYEGDSDKFKQEFPSNDRDCFLLSSRPRFSPVALRNMRVETTRMENEARRVCMVAQGEKRVSVRPDPAGEVRIWEEPLIGCRYIGSVDTCQGKDQQLSSGTTADPDFHSVGIWRDQYYDPRTDTHWRKKLVAHHRSQIDADVLVSIVANLSWYYGGCMMVVELNNGAGFHLVKELVKRKVNLYRRAAYKPGPPGKKTEDEKLEAFGWNTDKETKRWLIDSVVPLVRDEQVELSDMTVQNEFEAFIVNKHGQAQAMPGKHDDCVMMAALGLYNIGTATEFKPQFVRSVDLMRLARDPRYMTPGGFWRE